MAFACGTCWRTWPTDRSREQHVAATFHKVPDFECDSCDRYFNSQQAVDQYMTALDHWADSVELDEPEHYCDYDSCSEAFSDEDELRAHEVTVHFYCDTCDREFQDENSIRNHRNSKVHRGQNMPCYLCDKPYVTAAGVFHHLERGRCSKAPLDRMKVYEAVKRRDPNGLLTERLLEWSGSGGFAATLKSWNASAGAFECFLCKRLFERLDSLNQHLQSPKHQQKLYHCPKQHCNKKFGSLAAAANHMESESCGFMSFEAVQESAKRIFDPGRMIAF
ncbi:zinc finger protein [Colletotrichum sojae]|uniref:Zinc finger protein n=1 Tax=Colletotrichum sojae TaxID=2175907 RepID=A0A8H6MLS5_9PEZI|nr:zinc finger protein [Colletotrichum sojae]